MLFSVKLLKINDDDYHLLTGIPLNFAYRPSWKTSPETQVQSVGSGPN